MKDIYFEENYCKINEKIEDGTSVFFDYSSEEGNITYNFLKRLIPQTIHTEINYYDIISPYGYGGPIINQSNNIEKLIEGFNKKFSKYCKENNIVSEFVRFHPILENYKSFDSLYNIEYLRNTIATNLKDYDNPFQEEFSKSTRKQIRKILKNEISYEVIESPSNLSNFLNIYYSTMDRKNSDGFYYFNEQYFLDLLKEFKNNILLIEVKKENEIIGMGFYFRYKNLLHAHLSGTLSNYLEYSPAYIIKYAITEWGKKNDYDFIHHGGGLSNDSNDNLYKFKKRFGQNTEFKFYIGEKIWNQSIYTQLCEDNSIDPDSEFFPAYRLKN